MKDSVLAAVQIASRAGPSLPVHHCYTGAVHRFGAALVRHACAFGWEVAQLDPPHRASRYFRHGDGLGSAHPDAFDFLRREGKTWAFFLEWERRAVRPVTLVGGTGVEPVTSAMSTQRSNQLS